jgi:tol-pal system protein YbgF
MRTKLLLPLALLLFALPALAVDKNIIQLQTQVQALQDQMSRMQQAFDERMGVMRNLIEQSTDNMNKVTSAVTALNQELQKQHNESGSRVDQVSAQIQALNDSVDELKARMGRVQKQLEDVAAAQQNIPQQQPAAAPGLQPGVPGTPGAQGPPANQAPPADVLYNNALRDYNGAKYDLASQEFQDYLKFYPNTDLAGNAQFYLADIEYRQGNFDAAVRDYDKVLEMYPGGNKAAAAQLKKGFAQIELGQRDAGARTLRALVNRYPRSIEAQQASERLRRLGPAAPAKSLRQR